jgi:uncharacterized protein YerC
MAHISKNKLSDQELTKLFIQFNKTIGNLNPKSCDLFLHDLLGNEERIMLAKRLSAVAMFAEGNSSYRVWQLLKLSPSTADRIRLDFENGRYNRLVKILRQDKASYRDFWQVLETILQAGMPPRGRGRWKSVLEKL